MFAVNRGHLNIVKKLVDLGAKLEVVDLDNENTALHLACTKGYK
jgi:ankyrin repeat protein